MKAFRLSLFFCLAVGSWTVHADFSGFWAGPPGATGGWFANGDSNISGQSDALGCKDSAGRSEVEPDHLTLYGCTSSSSSSTAYKAVSNIYDGGATWIQHSLPFNASSANPVNFRFDVQFSVTATNNLTADKPIEALFTIFDTNGRQDTVIASCTQSPCTINIPNYSISANSATKTQTGMQFWIRTRNVDRQSITSQLTITNFGASPAPDNVTSSWSINDALVGQFVVGWTAQSGVTYIAQATPSSGSGTTLTCTPPQNAIQDNCTFPTDPGTSNSGLNYKVTVSGTRGTGANQITATSQSVLIPSAPADLLGSVGPSYWSLSRSSSGTGCDSSVGSSDVTTDKLTIASCDSAYPGVSVAQVTSPLTGTVNVNWFFDSYWAFTNPNKNVTEFWYQVGQTDPVRLTYCAGDCWGTPTTLTGGNNPGEQSASTSIKVTKGDVLRFYIKTPNGVTQGQSSTPGTQEPLAVANVYPMFTFTVPDSPTMVTATASSQQATVSWNAPLYNGGRFIENYTVTALTADGQSLGGAVPFICSATAPTTTCTVGGLTNNTAYKFQVVATNAVGDSIPAVTGVSVTPTNTIPPNPPTITQTTLDDQKVSLTWISPNPVYPSEAVGTVTPSTYTCALSPESGATLMNPPIPYNGSGPYSCSFSDLTNGRPYVATITINAGNLSNYTVSSILIPRTVPGAPRNVSAIGGDRSATVTWSPPYNNGGSEILGYLVTAKSSTNSTDKTCLASGSSATSCTFMGGTDSQNSNALMNGVAYDFEVIAQNMAGSSIPAITQYPVTPMPTNSPGILTGIMAKPGDAKATIRWTPDTNDNDQPIQQYIVNALGTDRYCYSEASANSCTVIGLTNGQSYSFVVKARNSFGIGLANTPDSMSTAIPFTVPDSPQSPELTTGLSQQLIAIWKNPTFDGGSPIMSYQALAYELGSTTSTNNMCTIDESGTTCSIRQLDPNKLYTVKVIAINAAGPSAPSVSSNAISPTYNPYPDIPLTIPAIPAVGPAIPDIIPPIPTSIPCIPSILPGTPETSAVLLNVGLGLMKSPCARGTGDNIDPMTPSVSTVTANGSVTIVMPPRDAVALPGNGSVTVSWTPPSMGLNGISQYRVTLSNGSTCTAMPPQTSCTISGLNNGQSYTAIVEAITTSGTILMGVPTNSVTPFSPSETPNTVTGVKATPTNGGVSVTWLQPFNFGPPILSYKAIAIPTNAIVSNASDLNAYPSCSVSAPTTTCVIEGLNTDLTYDIVVIAINSVGNSPIVGTSSGGRNLNGAVTISIMPSGVPGIPTITQAVAGNASATISWTGPSSPGNSPIQTYVVRASTGEMCTASAQASSCTVFGLRNGTPYTFTVAAINAQGAGMFSPPSEVVIPSPTASQSSTSLRITLTSGAIPTIRYSSSSAKVSWIAPKGPIEPHHYVVKALPGKASCTTRATRCTINGLKPNKTYVFNLYTIYRDKRQQAVIRSSSETATTPVANTPAIEYPLQMTASNSVGASASAGTGTLRAAVAAGDNRDLKQAQAPLTIDAKVLKATIGHLPTMARLSVTGGSGTGEVSVTATPITPDTTCKLVMSKILWISSNASTLGSCSVAAIKEGDANYAPSSSQLMTISQPHQ